MNTNVNRANAPISPEALSEREIQVAELLAYGYTDKEIASILILSPHTIRTHHQNINEKTGSHNLADVARWYFGVFHDIDLPKGPSKLHVVMMLAALFIVIIGEISNREFLRTSTARVVRVQRTGKRKENNTLKLA